MMRLKTCLKYMWGPALEYQSAIHPLWHNKFSLPNILFSNIVLNTDYSKMIHLSPNSSIVHAPYSLIKLLWLGIIPVPTVLVMPAIECFHSLLKAFVTQSFNPCLSNISPHASLSIFSHKLQTCFRHSQATSDWVCAMFSFGLSLEFCNPLSCPPHVLLIAFEA